MATLQELLPFLRQGYMLQSVRGETIRPLGGSMVEWMKARGYRFEPERYNLAEIRSMGDAWSWGCCFMGSGKSVFIETDIAAVEKLIARGVKGAAYGAQPK